MSILADLRRSIDYLDDALIFTLAERAHVIAYVAVVGRNRNMIDEFAMAKLADFNTTMTSAASLNINRSFVTALFQRIHQESLYLIEQTPQVEGPSAASLFSLQELQQRLSRLDHACCYICAERFQVVSKIGQLKQQIDFQARSPKRWREVLDLRAKRAGQLGIRVSFMHDLFNLIHEESLAIEREIISSHSTKLL